MSTAAQTARTLGEGDDNSPLVPPPHLAATELPTGETTDDAPDEDFLAERGIQSRPVPGGKWNVKDPLRWADDYGRRSDEQTAAFAKLAHLKPDDEGYIPAEDSKDPAVTIVRTVEHAERVVKRLMAAAPGIFHACDTEVMGIDLKAVGPVGNGYVTCVSMYAGPDFDYGDGPGTCLWVDNLDDAYGVLQVFKEWFEDERHWKVWHNYGFDRHMMWNEGIDVRGFGGDTMHMARLQDTARLKGRGGYSLEALTDDLLNSRKKPMKEIFGVKRLRKDGTEGILVDMPPIEVMQRDPKHRTQWIQYSCYDAKGTWDIRKELADRLANTQWIGKRNLYEYYELHMRPFGEVLTDMERRGIRVDAKDYLAKVEVQARIDRKHHCQKFREWAAQKIGPDGWAVNLSSSVQLQTLLFGGSRNSKTLEFTEPVRVFKLPREDMTPEALEAYRERDEAEKALKAKGKYINRSESSLSVHEMLTSYLIPAETSTGTSTDEPDELDQMKVAQLKLLCKERGLKVAGKKAVLKERLREHFLCTAMPDESAEDGEDEFNGMSDEDLRDTAKARGLKIDGARDELLERIRGDIKYTKELLSEQAPTTRDGYVAISQALEEAARKEGGALAEYLDEFKLKSKVPPKFIDVKITSLGKLEPDTFTANGAPSVTSAVLRKLAGDPFADPPHYGTVRICIIVKVFAFTITHSPWHAIGVPTSWQRGL
jgi:hypothetical protein